MRLTQTAFVEFVTAAGMELAVDIVVPIPIKLMTMAKENRIAVPQKVERRGGDTKETTMTTMEVKKEERKAEMM